MATLFFHDEPVQCWDQASQCDTEKFGRYFWAMMERGVYLPCSQYEAFFLSTQHTESHIESTIDAAREALAQSQ